MPIPSASPDRGRPKLTRRVTACVAVLALTAGVAGLTGCTPMTREDCESAGGTWRTTYSAISVIAKPRNKTRSASHYCDLPDHALPRPINGAHR